MSDLSPWAFAVPVAALAMVSVIVWLEMRVQQARTDAQRDVQLALLQKFNTGDELSRFLATEEGRQLLDKLTAGSGRQDPRKTTIEMLTKALVLIFLGIGFCVMGPKLQVFFVPGILCFAIGLGFLVAAGVAYKVSKKIGLIPAGESK